MAGGYFTDVLHSLKDYPQKHAAEQRQLPKYVTATLGAVMFLIYVHVFL